MSRSARFAVVCVASLLAAGCASVTTSPEPRAMADPTFRNQPGFVPEWAKDVVWYQVFPERFANGDPSNDPTLADMKGAWPHDLESPWGISPWESDWYQMQPWEKANGHDIWWNIQRRRYGGDLQGIIDHLDYLQDLGISALYLNPIFMAPSLHKYDGLSYHHVEPTFGPDPAGDRALIATEDPTDPSTWVWTSADKLALKLIEEAHARDMRIIFDGVFNHMGFESFAFRDVRENQQASKYRDWFTIKSWDDPAAGTKFDYEGWFGVKDLPELREDANGIVSGPKEYIFASTSRWMDPTGTGDTSKGIDGWRLDVAFCVAHPFWKDWRAHVKSINPEAYLTAEVVEPPAKMKPYLQGDEFDALMNYNFAMSAAEGLIERAKPTPPTVFDARLREVRDAFHPSVAYVQQNLFDSHDTNRISSHIVNRNLGSYRQWGNWFQKSKGENPNYDVRKPTDAEYELQKLFVVLQMTYVGAPMVYYGDEAGMWGANDPCCRKPMVWPGAKHDDERALPNGAERTPDTVEFRSDMHAHYRRLIAIRNAHASLRTGSFTTVLTDDAAGTFGYLREGDGERIIVVLNPTDEPKHAALEAEGLWTDLLTEGEPAAAARTVPARGALVLLAVN